MSEGSPASIARASAARSLPVLSFGVTPVADILLTGDQLGEPEPAFPLDVVFDPETALLQLAGTIPPGELYGGDYPYYSSEVPSLLQHFRASAQKILAERALDRESLVIEAASNDGYMLEVFAGAGVPVLGIDPASGPAAVAQEKGIRTVVDFFDLRLARRLRREGHVADVLLGNNVLNLVREPGDFASAVEVLLGPDGVAVLEVPYVVATVESGAYDNFYHQNSSYFSLVALERLFGAVGLVLREAQRVPTFGGSLRVQVGRGGRPGRSAREMLESERARGVHTYDYFMDFGERSLKSRDLLIEMLRGLKGDGASIVAYGAAGGMATTLLSFTGIDSSVLDYAVDVNPHKHGLFTPGSHLQIHSPRKLLEDLPDYVLLLAWNYADEVVADQREYLARGGRFIIPIPEPRLL